MYYFNFLIICLAAISGLYVGVVAFRQYKNITITAEKVSTLQIMKIAARFGAAGSLIFFGIMISASVFDEKYIGGLPKIGSTIFVALIPGIIITLGAAYQIYTTMVFRDRLIRKHKDEDK